MAWNPERELDIIAGTPPGGGLDRSARALAAAVAANKLVPVPIKVVNVGGDGGRKAWTYMASRSGDPHVIGISSPNMAADFLMGVTTTDPDHFPPIAILYSEYIVFVVRAESSLRNGNDLVRRLADSARSIKIALSTSLGNSNHVAVAKVIRHAGVDTKVPQIRVFDTALDAVADVAAGHADVGAITAASPVPELAAGRLRAIGISSKVRVGGLYANTPTWVEQGVDCVIGSWRGVSGAPGINHEQIAFWRTVLASAIKTVEWKADLARHFWTEMHLDGEELSAYLKREREDMRKILDGLGLLHG
jgi:putative tricarboxylic transport membrane protein